MPGETTPANSQPVAQAPSKPEPTKEEKDAAANLAKAKEMIPQVEVALTKKRVEALSKQPMCIAREGGMDAVMLAACLECVGFEKPVLSAANRVLQLCGSSARSEEPKPAEAQD